jgi:hypothetical protein
VSYFIRWVKFKIFTWQTKPSFDEGWYADHTEQRWKPYFFYKDVTKWFHEYKQRYKLAFYRKVFFFSLPKFEKKPGRWSRFVKRISFLRGEARVFFKALRYDLHDIFKYRIWGKDPFEIAEKEESERENVEVVNEVVQDEGSEVKVRQGDSESKLPGEGEIGKTSNSSEK